MPQSSPSPPHWGGEGRGEVGNALTKPHIVFALDGCPLGSPRDTDVVNHEGREGHEEIEQAGWIMESFQRLDAASPRLGLSVPWCSS